MKNEIENFQNLPKTTTFLTRPEQMKFSKKVVMVI